jgi:hypothetical protein
MIIQKTRIKKLPSQLRALPAGKRVVVAVRLVPADLPVLQKIGFPEKPEVGDTVLPSKIGSRTQFNAEGGELVHRDQPMETAFQTIEWKWEEFHGRYEKVERTAFRDRPYKRYPRTKLPAPAIEITMTAMTDGQRAAVTPQIKMTQESELVLIERINLLLEIFGRCEVFSENLASLVQAPIRKLNWELLRSGQWTWERLKQQLRNVLDKEEKSNRSVIEARFEFLNSCKPDFIAVGAAGFAGYVVFGFDEHKRYILESIYPDNATYIFAEQWEALSQMTKAQIIENDLAEFRIAHRQTWWDRMRLFVGQMRKARK